MADGCRISREDDGPIRTGYRRPSIRQSGIWTSRIKARRCIAAGYVTNTHLSYRIGDTTNLHSSGSVDYGRTDYDSYRHIGGYGDLNHGHGFGADIGVQFVHADEFKLGFSVMDIGGIRFDRKAAAFRLQSPDANFSNWGQVMGRLRGTDFYAGVRFFVLKKKNQ